MLRFAACSLFALVLACGSEPAEMPGAPDGGAPQVVTGAGGVTSGSGGSLGTVAGTGGALAGGSGGTVGGTQSDAMAMQPDALTMPDGGSTPGTGGKPATGQPDAMVAIDTRPLAVDTKPDAMTYPTCREPSETGSLTACARVDQYQRAEWQRKDGYRCAVCLWQIHPGTSGIEQQTGCIRAVPGTPTGETAIICVQTCNECAY